MIRLLHLEITDTCGDCPYCTYSNIDHEYFCDNQDTSHSVDTTSLLNSIPEWCPLPEYVEGGKF
jgi:hypothetical protein